MPVRATTSWVARVRRALAYYLHRFARRLGGQKARPNLPSGSTDRILAQLRARFPGAPDHWLAAIAERMIPLADYASMPQRSAVERSKPELPMGTELDASKRPVARAGPLGGAAQPTPPPRPSAGPARPGHILEHDVDRQARRSHRESLRPRSRTDVGESGPAPAGRPRLVITRDDRAPENRGRIAVVPPMTTTPPANFGPEPAQRSASEQALDRPAGRRAARLRTETLPPLPTRPSPRSAQDPAAPEARSNERHAGPTTRRDSGHAAPTVASAEWDGAIVSRNSIWGDNSPPPRSLSAPVRFDRLSDAVGRRQEDRRQYAGDVAVAKHADGSWAISAPQPQRETIVFNVAPTAAQATKVVDFPVRPPSGYPGQAARVEFRDHVSSAPWPELPRHSDLPPEWGNGVRLLFDQERLRRLGRDQEETSWSALYS